MEKENDISGISFSFKEETGNIWEYEDAGMLAVFVAASCDFRHGLPQVFRVRYGINEVPCEWAGAGRCVVCNNVLLLVISQYDGESVYIENLKTALAQMKDFAIANGIKRIIIPQYGGLEEWTRVKNVIMDVCGGAVFEVIAVAPEEKIEGRVMDPDTEKQLYKKGLIDRYYT